MPCPEDMLPEVTRTPLKSPLLRTNVLINHLVRASAGRRPGAPVLSLVPNYNPQVLCLKIPSYQAYSQDNRLLAP